MKYDIKDKIFIEIIDAALHHFHTASDTRARVVVHFDTRFDSDDYVHTGYLCFKYFTNWLEENDAEFEVISFQTAKICVDVKKDEILAMMKLTFNQHQTENIPYDPPF